MNANQSFTTRVIATIKKAKLPYSPMNSKQKSGISAWTSGRHVHVDWRMPIGGVRYSSRQQGEYLDQAQTALRTAGFVAEYASIGGHLMVQESVEMPTLAIFEHYTVLQRPFMLDELVAECTPALGEIDLIGLDDKKVRSTRLGKTEVVLAAGARLYFNRLTVMVEQPVEVQ